MHTRQVGLLLSHWLGNRKDVSIRLLCSLNDDKGTGESNDT